MLNTLLYYLPLLMCPIGMGLMMWLMGRSSGHDQTTVHTRPMVNPTARLLTLHAERRALDEEIAVLTKVVQREGQGDQLRQQQSHLA